MNPLAFKRSRVPVVLPDIGTQYVLDYAYAEGIAENELLNYKAYGFTVSSDGIDLASVTMNVFSSPQFQPMPEARTEDPVVLDTRGPRIITPIMKPPRPIILTRVNMIWPKAII